MTSPAKAPAKLGLCIMCTADLHLKQRNKLERK
jgi:hypothetical protein